MVKRATIHVYSRTKKKSSENGEIRGIKRKQQIQPIQYFTTKLPLQGKQVAILSSRSCCFKSSCNGPGEAVVLVVYLAEGLYTRVACFVLAKLFHFMALFLAMA